MFVRVVVVALLLSGCLAAPGGPGDAVTQSELPERVPVLIVEGTHSFGAPVGVICDVGLDWQVDLLGRAIHSPHVTGNTSAAVVTSIRASDWDDGCYRGHRLALSDGGAAEVDVASRMLSFQMTLVDGWAHVAGTGLPAGGVLLQAGASAPLAEGDWRVRYVGHMALHERWNTTTWPFGVIGNWYPSSMPDWSYAMLHVTSDIREEGPPYEQDSYCGQSVPLAQIDVDARAAWIDGGRVALDPWRDEAVLLEQPRIKYMHSSGCEPSRSLHSADVSFSVFGQEIHWNITRSGGLIVDGVRLDPGHSIARDVEATFDYTGAGTPLQGRYWYNGTVTLTNLGDWSWQNVHPVAGHHEFPGAVS